MQPTSVRPIRIAAVDVLRDFTVRLGLTDGSAKVVNLEPYLRGPIFEPMRNDPSVFAAVRVDSRAGTIVWLNGADINPDVLCQNLTPAEAPIGHS